MSGKQLSRRRVLAGSVSLSAIALAGCVGGDDDDAGNGVGGDDTTDADDAMDDGGDAASPRADEIPEELPTDPDEDDFVDVTGEETVEVVTRDGEDGEPQWVFDAPFVLVDPGTTVRWVNTDGAFHTVTSIPALDDLDGGGDVFDAELDDAGDEFEWAVHDEPGLQHYYCLPHLSFMWGSVAVADGGEFPADAPGDEHDDGDDGDDPADDPDDDADDANDEEETEELTTDPDDGDFVDRTGEDVVEVETRWGEGTEPEFVFDPVFVRVDQGATLRWVNTDGVFHTVTSTNSLDNRSGGGDEFDATISSEGDTFEWTAEEVGRQDYYCSPHAGFMWGSVDVV